MVSTIRHPVRVVATAAVIGLLAQLLFYDVGLGLNLPIATATLLVAGWALRDPAKPAPRLLDAWLPLAALAFASFVALRGDATLVSLDILAALGLTGAALASFAGMRVVERSMAGIVLLGTRMAGWAGAAAARVLAGLRGAVPLGGGGGLHRVAPIVRGLFLAIPLLIVFVVLFSSADAVFAKRTADLFDIDLGSVPGRALLALIAAWLAAGLLGFVVSAEDRDIGQSAVAAWGARSRLGSIEAVTVLVVLDLLFAVFVALQATYLFGGQDTLDAGGLTYADYARRGFFELLAVAFVVGGIVLALETFVARRTAAYRASLIGLIALTVVVLASAFLRLRLYQDAYGWTELRFYVLAAIAWLAIGSALAVYTVLTDRTRWLPHGMLALSVVFGLAFNVIGPVRFIAEQNVARAIHPELVAPGGETGFDLDYLAFVLGDDAIVVLEDHLDELPADIRAQATGLLDIRLHQLADSSDGEWQAWNLSRQLVRDRDPARLVLLR